MSLGEYCNLHSSRQDIKRFIEEMHVDIRNYWIWLSSINLSSSHANKLSLVMLVCIYLNLL